VPELSGRIEGGCSLGQYIRIVRMKSPFGEGSQLASLSLPGDSFWKYSVSEPSELNFGLSLMLTVTCSACSGKTTNHRRQNTW